MNKRTGKIAFCGMMTALSLVILFATVVPITEISLAALAGIVGIPVVVEVGRKYGLITYATVSLLSLLLVPTIEGKALYIAFFGYYPVLKATLEYRRLHPGIEWTAKFAIFNIATVAAYVVMLQFFSLPADSFTIGGVSLPWVFLLIGNGIFWLYDRCLTGLLTRYLHSLQPKLRRLFRL